VALFISYSSRDRLTLDPLLSVLRDDQQQVWFDQELGGGDSWWNRIVEQIGSCDVFLIALSNHWLQSKPCQAEIRYAQAMQRPILPVRIGPVDSVRVNSVAAVQIIDFESSPEGAGQIIAAIRALQAQHHPLPDPLPEPPPVPFGYLMRIGDAMTEKELSPQQQLHMLVDLKAGLDEDGDDPAARSDIAQLLRMLRMRHDVTYRTRTEIDNVLATLEPSPQPSPATPELASVLPPAGHHAAASGSAGGSGKRWALVAGAAVAVVAVVVCVVLALQGNRRPSALQAAGPSSSSPAATAPSSGAPSSTGVAQAQNAAELDALLLPGADIGTILGDPNVGLDGQQLQRLRENASGVSNQQCVGTFESLESVAYGGFAGLQGVRGQAYSASAGGGDPAQHGYQGVALFATADQAAAFVQTSLTQWQACAGQSITVTDAQSSTDWTFGTLEGQPPKIWMTRTATEGRTCHHVLAASGNVVIDVVACGHDEAVGTAGAIADAIGNKIPSS
jgi:serine/threonine kinase PknH